MLEIRERDENGDLQPPKAAFSPFTQKEQIEMMGMQLAMERITNMQAHAEKDALIDSLGAQLAQMRFDIILLKGGGM